MFRSICLVIIVFFSVHNLSVAQTDRDAVAWAKAAFEFADKIEVGDRRDQAFYRLTYPLARIGSIDAAMKCAENVTAAQKRVYAFAFTARQAAAHNELASIQPAIEKARQTSKDSDNLHAHSHVVKLLIEFEQVDEAIDFSLRLGRKNHRHYTLNNIAADLASHGDVDRALSIIENNIPENQRNNSYSRIAVACANANSATHAENLLGRISDPRFRDNPLNALAKIRSRNGEFEKARKLATQVSNIHQRGELLAVIADQQTDSVDDDSLQRRYTEEKEREAKLKLAEKIVKRYIAKLEFSLASDWIDKAVDVIKSHPMEPQKSKFGHFGDETRITTVRMLHLDIATALHGSGDIDEAVKHIEIAKRSLKELDDSSGLGLFFLQARLTGTVESLKLGERVRAATAPLEFLKPMATVAVSVSLVKEGRIEQAMKVAADIQPKQGTGVLIGRLIAALVERDEQDQAIKLLTRLEPSADIGYAYESFGKSLLETERLDTAKSHLPQLANDAARAHMCIGISEALQQAKCKTNQK